MRLYYMYIYRNCVVLLIVRSITQLFYTCTYYYILDTYRVLLSLILRTESLERLFLGVGLEWAVVVVAGHPRRNRFDCLLVLYGCLRKYVFTCSY